MNVTQKGTLTVTFATVIASAMIIMTGNSHADGIATNGMATNSGIDNNAKKPAVETAIKSTIENDEITPVNGAATKAVGSINSSSTSEIVTKKVKSTNSGSLLPPPPGPFIEKSDGGAQIQVVATKHNASLKNSLEAPKKPENIVAPPKPMEPSFPEKPVAPSGNNLMGKTPPQKRKPPVVNLIKPSAPEKQIPEKIPYEKPAKKPEPVFKPTVPAMDFKNKTVPVKPLTPVQKKSPVMPREKMPVKPVSGTDAPKIQKPKVPVLQTKAPLPVVRENAKSPEQPVQLMKKPAVQKPSAPILQTKEPVPVVRERAKPPEQPVKLMNKPAVQKPSAPVLQTKEPVPVVREQAKPPVQPMQLMNKPAVQKPPAPVLQANKPLPVLQETAMPPMRPAKSIIKPEIHRPPAPVLHKNQSAPVVKNRIRPPAKPVKKIKKPVIIAPRKMPAPRFSGQFPKLEKRPSIREKRIELQKKRPWRRPKSHYWPGYQGYSWQTGRGYPQQQTTPYTNNGQNYKGPGPSSYAPDVQMMQRQYMPAYPANSYPSYNNYQVPPQQNGYNYRNYYNEQTPYYGKPSISGRPSQVPPASGARIHTESTMKNRGVDARGMQERGDNGASSDNRN